MLETGVKGEGERMVTADITAEAMLSGAMPVFATPAMTALMEEVCWKSVQPLLEEGQTTVGTRLEIDHLAPTPVGMKVYCESILTEMKNRKLIFDVKAFAGDELIGAGVHERFIVDREKFMEKAQAKLQ